MENTVGRFTQMGKNIYKIADKLIKNQELCKLVFYCGNKPLSKSNIENTESLIDTHFILSPLLPDAIEDKGAVIAIIFNEFSSEPSNDKFKIVELDFLILLSPRQWQIEEEAPRPFLIMEQIDKMFNGARLEGIGKLKFVNSPFATPTENYSGYIMKYVTTDFD